MDLRIQRLERELARILAIGSQKQQIYSIRELAKHNICLGFNSLLPQLQSLGEPALLSFFQNSGHYPPSSRALLAREYLNHPSLKIRLAVARTLDPHQIDADLLKLILKMISNCENEDLVATLMERLDVCADLIPVKFFESFIKQASPRLMISTLKVLVNTASDETREIFVQMLNSTDSTAKALSLLGLWKLGEPTYLSYLEQILNGESSLELSRALLYWCTETGHEASIQAKLFGALNKGPLELSLLSARALGAVGEENHVDELLTTAMESNSPLLRAALVQTCLKIHEERTVNSLATICEIHAQQANQKLYFRALELVSFTPYAPVIRKMGEGLFEKSATFPKEFSGRVHLLKALGPYVLASNQEPVASHPNLLVSLLEFCKLS